LIQIEFRKKVIMIIITQISFTSSEI